MTPAVPSTVDTLLHQHSTNLVHETGYRSSSQKKWLRKHEPVATFAVHTTPTASGSVFANFDGPLTPIDADDDRRMARPAYPPNQQDWTLNTEADAAGWFHHEVSSPVLAAFRDPTLTGARESKALSEDRIDEVVDVLYSVSPEQGHRLPVLIVEMKRNLIDPDKWQRGRIGPNDSSQTKLGRELRGYGRKYDCPQIICFDGTTALMLQFRARNSENIDDSKCEIDCWVIPRYNPGGCTLRYALYRFLVQGFRRCQGLHADRNLCLDGVVPKFEYFSGKPKWVIQGEHRAEPPEGWVRHIDLDYGAFYFIKNDDPQTKIWETLAPFWNAQTSARQQQNQQQLLEQQLEPIDEEGLYD